jgi:adenine-specific DNA-methyltransferase
MSKKKDAPNPIEAYLHTKEERLNNPPVGMVDPDTDPDGEQKKYSYDPHIDPQLHWAGKSEHLSFEVPTVSLHVHERIDPLTIIEAVRKRENDTSEQMEISLFSKPEENPPIREAIQFYKHKHNWSNRLIAGDSLLVMNSLLEKEGMSGKVQMVYFDPPYGIKYSSNFQPFMDKSSVSMSDKDDDLSSEPEMIKAFRDTWELGIHSYLTYLRDRLVLCRSLLNDSGSVFVQISDENVHRVRLILDEIFGAENFVSQITIKRASVMFAKKLLNNAVFYVIWYAKDKDKVKYNQLYFDRDEQWFADSAGSHLRAESPDGKVSVSLSGDERRDMKRFMMDHSGWRLYHLLGINAQGTEKREPFEFDGRTYVPPSGTQWKYSYQGLEKLKSENRLEKERNTIRCKIYLDDFPVVTMNSLWEQIGAAGNKIYVVQTSDEIVKRCMLMTSMPGDLVLDITCGSGTTAYVAEQFGRRWITCDTSRIALTLAKQRLMTSLFEYFELARPHEGISSGFKYRKVPHVTLGSIANEETTPDEDLVQQPKVERGKARVSGPFTVEAVPAPAVKSIDEIVNGSEPVADESIARSGETLRQSEWRDELLKTGVRGKNKQYIRFSRIEVIPGYRWIHAVAETIPESDKAITERVAVSFASEFMPLEQRQVALALEEAQSLVPKPKILIFAAFQFDPEASKDIDETNWPGVQMLRVQMNADLLTEDLKKKRASNDSFWLIGQPEIVVEKDKDGKYLVKVLGFDYYNTRTGQIESGGKDKIAMWMLDTDYDGRSLFPKQVFLPLAGDKEGWSKLAKDLKASIDESLIDHYRGTQSLPFKCGDHKRIAVKIVDDRGIESLVIKGLD